MGKRKKKKPTAAANYRMIGGFALIFAISGIFTAIRDVISPPPGYGAAKLAAAIVVVLVGAIVSAIYFQKAANEE